jgi:hypothetical protein
VWERPRTLGGMEIERGFAPGAGPVLRTSRLRLRPWQGADAGMHRRLWASVWEWNTASFRVLQKLGFRDSGERDVDEVYGNTIWMVRDRAASAASSESPYLGDQREHRRRRAGQDAEILRATEPDHEMDALARSNAARLHGRDTSADSAVPDEADPDW